MINCPLPIKDYKEILIAHGGGGKLMNDLIGKLFFPLFSNEYLEKKHDGAVFESGGIKFAFTTDSYIISPLFFPGSDIGELAVYGTVNDLAMCGAKPLFLSAGFIIEEGFSMENLWKVSCSIQNACKKCNVEIIAADTKVVEKGKGDGLFINTSGIGIINHKLGISPRSVRQGDKIILSGDIGRHGIAVISSREDLGFETEIVSDCAPLNFIVEKLLDAGIEIHCMRDLTRGGLASALVEIAETSEKELLLYENFISVRDDVRSACEILGFDPMYVANEGRFVVIAKESDAEKIVKIISGFEDGKNASVIGEVVGDKKNGLVVMKNIYGASRIVDMFSGEQLPRIC